MNNREFLKNLFFLKDKLIDCKFLSDNKCSLGWYGGNPTEKNCLYCMAANRNNEEAKKISDAKAERTHPSNRARISGCCDSARNYIE